MLIQSYKHRTWTSHGLKLFFPVKVQSQLGVCVLYSFAHFFHTKKSQGILNIKQATKQQINL